MRRPCRERTDGVSACPAGWPTAGRAGCCCAEKCQTAARPRLARFLLRLARLRQSRLAAEPVPPLWPVQAQSCRPETHCPPDQPLPLPVGHCSHRSVLNSPPPLHWGLRPRCCRSRLAGAPSLIAQDPCCCWPFRRPRALAGQLRRRRHGSSRHGNGARGSGCAGRGSWGDCFRSWLWRRGLRAEPPQQRHGGNPRFASTAE